MKAFALSLLIVALSSTASAADGMIAKPSKHSVTNTMERLEVAVKEKGLTIFAKVDHEAGAEKIGLKMPPAQVLIFGNPKGGTPLMLASPSTALDLPLKMAVWEDGKGKVWLGYNSVSVLKARHDITGKDELVKTLDGLLDSLSSKATE